ncbi:MAG: CBS domain-containing protein [Clostridium sp.]|nr:CBS domain-containing protein [Clostridium sp.]MDY3827190.1 CBS domain-containing protein [Clostridium sp.]
MKRLTDFNYTDILNKKITDEFGYIIGELKDIYVSTDEGSPRIIGYMLKKNGAIFDYEFRTISFFAEANGKIAIRVKGSKEIIPRTYTYLLSENLLNKKVVDINEKKVVRVSDLRISEIAGEYRVVSVEVGNLARFKKIGLPNLGKALMKLLGKQCDDKIILWDDIEILNLINGNTSNVNLNTKLSSLHPADIADIIEELDESERSQVFESLDEDLAADTFEEIEDDDVKGSIIKDLSESKTAELLENMDNDEIADLLDELEGEEREKVLYNLEKEDAEEIEELLKYEDETVGSLMTKEFVAVNYNLNISETIEILKELDPDEDVMYYIYTIDEEGKLKGLVNLKDILIGDGNTSLKEIMETNIITTNHDAPVTEAIEQIAKYDLTSTAVIDEDNKLIGIVQIHDIVDEYLYPLWKKKNKLN